MCVIGNNSFAVLVGETWSEVELLVERASFVAISACLLPPKLQWPDHLGFTWVIYVFTDVDESVMDILYVSCYVSWFP